MARPPAAVLWDMDGTLVDTEPYWIEAEFRIVESFGGEWSLDHAHHLVGFDLIDAAEYIIANSPVTLEPPEVVERLLDHVVASVRREIPWRPGARELLSALNAAGVPCALVTMSWRRFADAVVEALPEGSFVEVICGDDVAEGKPHPEPYLTAAARLGVAPESCVAIEDSPTGMTSALAAGCRVIGVPNVRSLNPAEGAVILDTLEGLDASNIGGLHASRDRARSLIVLAAAVIVAALAVGWAVFGSSDDTNNNELALPPGVVAIDTWVPYWTLDRHLVERDITAARLAALREVSPFWWSATGTTEIVPDTYLDVAQGDAFVDLLDSAGVAVVPAVLDAMPAGEMSALLQDPDRRSRHVSALVNLVLDGDHAGVDIDYEQFAFADDPATWVDTKPAWVAFITELTAAMHAEGRTVSVSVPPVYVFADTGELGYWVYDHGTIAGIVDHVRIMAYDFSTGTAGPIAPITWVSDVIDGTIAAVDPEHHHKLVLGVPAYGYNWPIATVGTCPSDAPGRTGVTAANVDDLLARRASDAVYDPIAGEWSATYELEHDDGTARCVQTRRMHWVDAEGVAERVQMARRAGFGGVGLWAFGYDDDAVWSALVESASAEIAP
jgi:HAD superfamily hydrolase (TIGR01509 family)